MAEFDSARVRVEVQRDPVVQLSVIDAGPRHASPALLFVQGAGGHALQWVNQLRHFSNRYRCIAPDLRGHGRSDTPRDGYTVDQVTDDLVAVLDALDVNDPVIVLAHSAGGLVGINFAARYPERLSHLALINTAASLPLSKWMRLGLRIPSVLMVLIAPFLQRRGRFNAPPHIFKKFVEASVGSWQGWELLPKITTPTLAIAGQRDWYVRPSLTRRTVYEMPRARLEIIRAAGHQSPLERPAAVNRALERFITAGLRSWRSELEGSAWAAEGRRWLPMYESGVPAEVAVPEQPLHHFLEESARRWPDHPALIYGGRRLSYQFVAREARRWAGILCDIGVRKGDRVLILLPNVPQAVIALYGVLMAGAVGVSVGVGVSVSVGVAVAVCVAVGATVSVEVGAAAVSVAATAWTWATSVATLSGGGVGSAVPLQAARVKMMTNAKTRLRTIAFSSLRPQTKTHTQSLAVDELSQGPGPFAVSARLRQGVSHKAALWYPSRSPSLHRRRLCCTSAIIEPYRRRKHRWRHRRAPA